MRPCRDCLLLNRQSAKTRPHFFLKRLGPELPPGHKNYGAKPDETWQCKECNAVFIHTYSPIAPFGWQLRKTETESD